MLLLSGARTPIGAFQGSLAGATAPELGGHAIAAAVARAQIPAATVDEVLLGCVLQAGLGQAPARQAALRAGLPEQVPCTTINKVCGSGLKAVMLGAQAIRAGEAAVVVAGGMESMSNVPYYLPQARTGLRLGHGRVVDALIGDGLWDPGEDAHMGTCADRCARALGISRADQDAYAEASYQRALQAIAAGHFASEITPVPRVRRPGAPAEGLLDQDEVPGRYRPGALAGLPPVFEAEGTITVGNASALSDGAAAVVLADAEAAARLGLVAQARIVACAQAAQAPAWFTTAPVLAIQRVLAKAGLAPDAIDLYEVNEAFASVALATIRGVPLDPARVNVLGGAVALGHPIGASGARLLVTLVHALRARGLRRGCVALCIGGGEAVAMIVEIESGPGGAAPAGGAAAQR